MGPMDSFLGELYGTNKTAAAVDNTEDFEKEASVQLFMKLAGEQNIPLAEMPDADVQRLYSTWVEKAAEFPPPKKEGEEDEEKERAEKEHEARKEHQEKKAAAEKVSEADFLGRVMAHAYVQELQKIASASEVPAEEPVEATVEEAKEAAMPEALRKGLEAARGGAKAVGAAVSGAAGKAKGHAMAAKDKVVETAKKHPGKTLGAVGGAGFMAGGATEHTLNKHFDEKGNKRKKASAIDELAMERAVFIAHDGGFDAEEAGRKVAAVLELGLLGESAKTASAPDYETAIGVRALEYLESAGYEVVWNQ